MDKIFGMELTREGACDRCVPHVIMTFYVKYRKRF